MKKLFLLIITLCLFILKVAAQDSLYLHHKPYNITLSLGMGIPMSKPSATPIALNVIANYNFNQHWGVGIGGGYSVYDKISLLPIFFNGSYIIKPNWKFKPFIECNAGYAIALQKRANGGFLLSPSVGVKSTIWNKTILMSLGYDIQKLERKKETHNPYFSSEFVEKVSFTTLSIKLGIMF